MGTVYHIEAHNPTLLSSKINDTMNVSEGQTCTLRGSFPVCVPFDVPIDGVPTDLNDLITKKYAGMLSLYPGYENIVYDACVDGSSGWDPGFAGPGASPTLSATIGSRQTISVSHFTTTKLQSALVNLASVPSTAILRWELFKYVKTDVVNGMMTRVYQELDPNAAGITVTCTFTNLTGTSALTNGLLFEVPLANQGDEFRFRIASTHQQRVWVGSWALIY